MCKGIGLDLCEISRMEHLRMMTRFVERYFTPEEQAYVRDRGKNAAQTLAGLFAAKEAFGKVAKDVAYFAQQEGLTAHAKSALSRLEE